MATAKSAEAVTSSRCTFRMTLALASQTGRLAVLEEILRQAQRLVPCHTASIALVEDDTLRTACWRANGPFGSAEAPVGLVQSLADLPLDAEALRTGQPLVVADTHREPRWVRFEKWAWVRSTIAIPLCHRRSVLGLLRLASDTPGSFSRADAERLQPLASAAAVALDNARLYEQALQDAAAKARLLQEVNHRVKNNLAAIAGMLYLEQRNTERSRGPGPWQAFIDDLVNRIEGLATVHKLLSDAKWSALPLSALAEQVIDSALHSLPRDKRVRAEVRAEAAVLVTPKQANDLAIVVNELATNVAKYAVAEPRTTARVVVRIALDGDEVLFELRDDGPGFPEDVRQLKRQNVGMSLIQNIVRQNLRGAITLRNDGGAVVTIRFPEAVNQSRAKHEPAQNSASVDR